MNFFLLLALHYTYINENTRAANIALFDSEITQYLTQGVVILLSRTLRLISMHDIFLITAAFKTQGVLSQPKSHTVEMTGHEGCSSQSPSKKEISSLPQPSVEAESRKSEGHRITRQKPQRQESETVCNETVIGSRRSKPISSESYYRRGQFWPKPQVFRTAEPKYYYRRGKYWPM